jgi:hypothetical protein
MAPAAYTTTPSTTNVIVVFEANAAENAFASESNATSFNGPS